jgi:hypothetical protein
MIFNQQIDIIQLMRQKVNPENCKPYKFAVSNCNFLCSPTLELRALEPIFKN